MSPTEHQGVRAPALLTTSWDDGHPLDLRVAEMLARHGITGTFYVSRQTPYGTMDSAQLRELASGFEIGAHTLLHEQLTALPPSRSWQEIADSKHWIEDQTGIPCRMFCPPSGRFSKLHVGMAQRAGFIGLRSVELVSLALPRRTGGIWMMPTSVQAYDHDPPGYLRNFAKRAAIVNLWWYVRHGWGANWPRLATRLLARLAQTGGVFHLWGHSWELERDAQWQQLDEVLRWMRSYVPSGRTLANGPICELAGKVTEASVPNSGGEYNYAHPHRP